MHSFRNHNVAKNYVGISSDGVSVSVVSEGNIFIFLLGAFMLKSTSPVTVCALLALCSVGEGG